MTKEIINEYLYRREIPIHFRLEDNSLCRVNIHTDNFYLIILDKTEKYFDKHLKTYYKEYNSLRWEKSIINNMKQCIMINSYGNYKYIFEKETMEGSLSDFLFWWEINKERCKEIRYYEK